MMGKLWHGGRWEILFSPWRILTDHGQGWIQLSDTYFASNIFNTSYLLAADLGWWRSDISTLMFPYWQFLGSTFGQQCLFERKFLFSQLFWYNRHFISKTSVPVHHRHQIQELLQELPLSFPWPCYKALIGPGPGSLQMGRSTVPHADPQHSQEHFPMGHARQNFLLMSYSSTRVLGRGLLSTQNQGVSMQLPLPVFPDWERSVLTGSPV